MPRYSWGLVSFCLNEQWLCALSLTFFFLKSSACSTSSPDSWCLSVFHSAQRGSRQGRYSLRMQQVFSPAAWRGELRGMCGMDEHGRLIAAEEAPVGSVLVEQSSLRRSSVGLCCLLAQTDPQSCWAALFYFFLFFFCLWVLYFFMSVLFTWVLGLVTITISTITLRSVFVLLILQGFSSWTLSQLSNSSSVKLSQGHPVLLHHQISPWAKDSWMLDWRLLCCYSYLEISGTSKWLSGWGLRSCCFCLRCVHIWLFQIIKITLKIVASGASQRIIK